MTVRSPPRSSGYEILLAGSALLAGAAAVFAWAACCVLPVALGAAGLTLAGTALIAGQRTWLTLAALAMLSAGWGAVWRRGRARAADAARARASPLAVGLLTAASLLALAALCWAPLIEPSMLRWIWARGLLPGARP